MDNGIPFPLRLSAMRAHTIDGRPGAVIAVFFEMAHHGDHLGGLTGFNRLSEEVGAKVAAAHSASGDLLQLDTPLSGNDHPARLPLRDERLGGPEPGSGEDVRELGLRKVLLLPVRG